MIDAADGTLIVRKGLMISQMEIVGLEDTRRASDANAIYLDAPCMSEVIDIRRKPTSMI